MPRRNRMPGRRPGPSTGAESALPAVVSSVRIESWRGEPWVVRTVSGEPGRSYRCPGCDQLIQARGHVVAWPEHDEHAEQRRHWHPACWQARDSRVPGVQRSRAAPRY